MYTIMKTVERIDVPVIITRDGNAAARHENAAIVFTHGAPAYIRAQEPFAIYPWDIVRQINRTSDERNGAKQEARTLRAEVERLQAENDHLKALHTEKRVALRDALGLTHDNHDHAGLCAEVKRIRAEWDHLSRYNSPEKLARLELRAKHDRDLLAKSLGVEARDVDHGDLCAIAKSMQADLASVTEQRDVLKRQIEELRAEMRKPAMSEPKQVEPGGPIWVRVVDTNSKHFGLVGCLEGIEFDSKCGDEMWSVDLGGIANVRWKANVFAVVDTGRQGPGPNEAPKPDAEHQQAHNRDKWRATCLAYGAKDCTVYFGPGSEMTLVVELKDSYRLEDVRRGLYNEHGLRPDQFTLREVRPIVDGVKPSAFKHPADNGQP